LTFGKLVDQNFANIINYFLTIDYGETIGMSNTTIKKNLALIRGFLHWAIDNGCCDGLKLPAQRDRLESARRPVIYLTWQELMNVYNFDFGKKNYLSHARDIFCFSCFTSLRYSDAVNLRRGDIVGDAIHVTTIKTADTLTIELNKYARAILNKYKDIPLPDNRALPPISNQKMNQYLKEIGQLCEVNEPISIVTYKGTRREDVTLPKWELLTTHAGRRTFVCNALMLGIPANIVMQWTGHSDYQAMKPYIAIADKARQEAMKMFDKS
jgi:integrase